MAPGPVFACPRCGSPIPVPMTHCGRCQPRGGTLKWWLLGGVVAFVALGVVGMCVGFYLMWKHDAAEMYRNRKTAPACAPKSVQGQSAAPEGKVVVLESARAQIGAEGGRISLGDGVLVVFPAGALKERLEVTVERLDALERYGPMGGERVALRCNGPKGTFEPDVELCVALPVGASQRLCEGVWCARFDPQEAALDGIDPEVREVQGRRWLVAKVFHFTEFLFGWFGNDPLPGHVMLDVPYYSQGASNYCWAASLQMVTQAVQYREHRTIADVVGAAGVDQEGVDSFTLRWGRVISEFTRYRTGLKPEILQWTAGSHSGCLDYIRRQLAGNRPVLAHLGFRSHAVVVVGYENADLFLHDPQCTDTASVGYTRVCWADLIANWSFSSFLTTLVIPSKTLDAARPEITVNIMQDGLRVFCPAVGSLKSCAYSYMYDHRLLRGYNYRSTAGEWARGPMFAMGGELRFPGEIEIVNSSRSAARDVTLWVDVYTLGTTRRSVSRRVTIHVAPNQSVRPQVASVAIRDLQDDSNQPAPCRANCTVLSQDKVFDQASAEFTLAAANDPAVVAATAGLAGVKFAGFDFKLKGEALRSFKSLSGDGDYTDQVKPWDCDEAFSCIVPLSLNGNVLSGSYKFKQVTGTLSLRATFSQDQSSITELAIQWTRSANKMPLGGNDTRTFSESLSVVFRDIPIKRSEKGEYEFASAKATFEAVTYAFNEDTAVTRSVFDDAKNEWRAETRHKWVIASNFKVKTASVSLDLAPDAWRAVGLTADDDP